MKILDQQDVARQGESTRASQFVEVLIFVQNYATLLSADHMPGYYHRTGQMHAKHADSRLGTPISTAGYGCPSPLIL
jgi:hypothetical protein